MLKPVATLLRIAACAALLSPLAACGRHDTGTPVVESDPRPGADFAPRRVLARIQSNLERVAAQRGQHVLPTGQRDDALERVVDAYQAFLSGNARAMDMALEDVARVAQTRRTVPTGKSEYERRLAEERDAYFAVVDNAAKSTQPLIRLLAGLRNADGVLFVEAAHTPFMIISEHILNAGGPAQGSPDPLNGSWLRLPCRTVHARVAEFVAAAEEAKALGGPLLACPTDRTDFVEIDALLAAPTRFEPHVPKAPSDRTDASSTTTGDTAAVPPPPPWNAKTAVRFMAENPDVADVALEAAATDAVGKLDYALFLHTFRPTSPVRNARIVALLRDVEEAPPQDDGQWPDKIEGADAPYDGSDASLVPRIIAASENGIANTASAFYAIPCDILLARPKLLVATEARYYSNRDNFTPRSGCSWDRGEIRGFPDAELASFVDDAAEADGYFIATFGGTMKYGFEAAQAQAEEALRIDPRGLLEKPEPKLDYPYQTWGLLSLGNRRLADTLHASYTALQAKITAYFEKRGLTHEEGLRAAKTGIFAVLLGPDCGGASPVSSPRATLLAGGVPADLDQLAADDVKHDAPETEACAEFAGMDPLLHVAVASPKALAALLARAPDADLRDDIGKTPLMLAAQHDLLDSARLLLAHKAAVDATTFVPSDPRYGFALAHDARTPLMYAAASGSLDMIRLLLDAGADPYRADSKGARAIDYLLGFGPVAANARLPPEQRSEAVKMLF
jgi:hypothetical protein